MSDKHLFSEAVAEVEKAILATKSQAPKGMEPSDSLRRSIIKDVFKAKFGMTLDCADAKAIDEFLYEFDV